MNATAGLVLALVLAPTAALGIAAAVEAPPSLMSRADRLAAREEIARDTRLGLAHCRTMAGASERALCRAQVRGDERIAVAMLDARYLGTIQARQGLQHAQSRAAHSLGAARRLFPIQS